MPVIPHSLIDAVPTVVVEVEDAFDAVAEGYVKTLVDIGR